MPDWSQLITEGIIVTPSGVPDPGGDSIRTPPYLPGAMGDCEPGAPYDRALRKELPGPGHHKARGEEDPSDRE